MPRGDRTGPRGLGPRTGLGLGRCGGGQSPGYGARGRGLGLGMRNRWGWGGGGRGRRFGQGWDEALPAQPPPAPGPDLEPDLRREVRGLAAQVAELKSLLLERDDERSSQE